MRVVSWNLNRATSSTRGRFTDPVRHAHAAWSEVAGLGDVALLQEACPPPRGLERPPVDIVPDAPDDGIWRSGLPGERRPWCSAIASWTAGLEPFHRDGYRPLVVSHPGAYAIGTMPWRDTRIVLISLYALWDYDGQAIGSDPRYTETSLHRTLSDLTPVIDIAYSKLPVIVAGDFNASTQHKAQRKAYRLIHQRVVDLGLVNVSVAAEASSLAGCPCEDDPCRHVRTLEGVTPYQNDYLYASPEVADAMRFVEVPRTPAIEAVSDHLPLVAHL